MHKENPASRSWWLNSVVFFVVVAAIMSFSEWNSPHTVALKSTPIATVPLFNAWTIGWNADQALHGYQNYWDAPIFHPVRGSFAFSEPQPATVLVAPVVWLTGSAIAGYKAWWSLSLMLNGLLTAWLFRSLKLGWLTQISGGIAMMLLPIAHQRPDVLQLIPVWGILWFWGSIHLFTLNPTTFNSIRLGIAFAVSFFLCVHHALFLTLISLFACLVFVHKLRDRQFTLRTLLAISTAFLLVLPIALPMRHAVGENDFRRNEHGLLRLAATSEDYLAPPATTIIDWDPFHGKHRRHLNVGWLRTILGVAGLVIGLLCAQYRLWTFFLFMSAFAAYLFSLGGHLHIGEWTPWHFLREYVPGFAQVRNIFRFAWFVQMAFIVLAGQSLNALWEQSFLVKSSSFRKSASILLMSVLSLWFALEVWPPQVTRSGVPDQTQHILWTNYVRDHTPTGKVIACFPFSNGRRIEDYDGTARWMLLGLNHRVPMVNGYSGFFPESYKELKGDYLKHSLSTSLLPRLAEYDVHLVVVAKSFMTREQVQQIPTSAFKLKHVLEDPIGIDVYELQVPTTN